MGNGRNLHHLIFYRRNYTSGPGKELRKLFVYCIDETLHEELHRVVPGIPKPTDAELQEILLKYHREKWSILEMKPSEACMWLADACQDKNWRTEMLVQAFFLKIRGE